MEGCLRRRADHASACWFPLAWLPLRGSLPSPQRGLDRSAAEISWEEISQLDMIDISFGAVASQPRGVPFFDGYRICYSARFARHRSRLLASASRFASNSACRIAFGNSNARRTPERVRTSTSSY
jgi:hypothetical protein